MPEASLQMDAGPSSFLLQILHRHHPPGIEGGGQIKNTDFCVDGKLIGSIYIYIYITYHPAPADKSEGTYIYIYIYTKIF